MRVAVTGSGPPLVLLPGWGMAAAAWPELVAALAEDWQVWAADLPGHGDNRHIAFERETVVARLAYALPREAVWLGWSLGGQLALAAALAGVPVRALWLIGATPRFVAGKEWEHGVAPGALADLRRRVAADPRRGLARFVGLLGQGSAADAEAARLLRRRVGTVGHDPGSLLAGLDWLAETDLRAGLAGLAQPACWIGGDADPLVPAAAVRAGADRMPAGDARVIDGAGHLPFLTHRPALLSALAEVRTIASL